MKNKAKQEAKSKASTRQLIGTKAVTEYSLQTYGHGELVHFIIKPSNIRCCPRQALVPASMSCEAAGKVQVERHAVQHHK